MTRRNNNMKERCVSINAEPSSVKDATSGKIVINSQDFHKAIPAVVFTLEKAESLLEIVEEVYISTNK